MRVVFVHGLKSSPSDGFWPWFGDALRAKGHEVIAPVLPNAEAPNNAEWVAAIDDAIVRPGGDTIFVGHSLGCVALLHYLEQADMQGTPKSVILISAPFHIGAERFESFFQPPVDFDTAMWKGQEFVIVHAKDDKKIPFDHALKYEAELQGQLHAKETGGHFIEQKELPWLLDLVDARDVTPGETLPDDFAEIDVVLGM